MLVIKALQVFHLPAISVELTSGQCLVLRGASGTGKSVFLKACADLIPSKGQIWLAGQARHNTAGPDWRKRVCYVPAEPEWWAETGLDHFRDSDFAIQNAAQAGLKTETLKKRVSSLSTGQKQRLAFLLAMEVDPDIYLLDEPTSALDEKNTGIVEKSIKTFLERGKIVLLATHDEALGNRLADLFMCFEQENNQVFIRIETATV